jgi:hypothetical protein
MQTLIDLDIAHINRVMRPSLCEDRGSPIIPAEYWRRRLYRLLGTGDLTKTQFCAVDDLLRQLDHLAPRNGKRRH